MTRPALTSSSQQPEWAWFALAFRPFFGLGAIFGVICVGLWVASLSGAQLIAPAGGLYFWHMHEMLFGFVAAIVVGFLLTAVKSWTNQPGLSGPPLGLLVGVWFVGRVAMLLPTFLPANLIGLIDFLFLPLAAVVLARPVIRVNMWRNLIFAPILLLMSGLNAMMHADPSGSAIINQHVAAHGMILLVVLLMCVIGGRVFPMFTANGTQTPRVTPLPWLEKATILTTALCIPAGMALLPATEAMTGIILMAAGALNIWRASRWRFMVALQTPMLWSLHLSYWLMSIGLILIGLHQTTGILTASISYHVITLGGISLMILAMVTRVSLGHTGRKIQATPVITSAFLLMVAATFVRILPALLPGQALWLLILAGLLWMAAFSLFVIVFFPILSRARPDGTPG
ncbi:NnrS family protein [Oceanobacter sp. 4_MG-2023]|uniref:NnrS family protein n=1 Tax=Oceanobacter sp. 4_MG-2023 TaxID=3062623 RepID=UPI002736D70B|nr:NnrS family protein [Oceanobacter sp. 4_MG-2023]MDP2549229.1 NnrS family protein [Oceanobacter sp. 4_MG-2023]